MIRGAGVTDQGNACSYQFLKRSKEQACNCFLKNSSLLLSSMLTIPFERRTCSHSVTVTVLSETLEHVPKASAHHLQAFFLRDSPWAQHQPSSSTASATAKRLHHQFTTCHTTSLTPGHTQFPPACGVSASTAPAKRPSAIGCLTNHIVRACQCQTHKFPSFSSSSYKIGQERGTCCLCRAE